MILKKSVIILIAILYFVSSNLIFGEEIKLCELLLLERSNYNPYVEFVSSDIKDFFNPKGSSAYPSINLFDGSFKTCWVAGSTKYGSHELFIKLPQEIPLSKLILNIFPGYGKRKDLFYKNARPRTIRISLYAAFHPKAFETEVATLYLISKASRDYFIELTDIPTLQSFPFRLNQEALLTLSKRLQKKCAGFSGKTLESGKNITFVPGFILRLKVEDVYPGTKYDDICISEIFFNNRFVTAYPDKYRTVENVYIRDDHTLVADYSDKRGVVILSDDSAVYTLADWPKYTNWILLHYTLASESSETSRQEEYYSLIDLKAGKVVNSEFERCTSLFPDYGIMERKEDSRVFIELEPFSVELK